jgi:hypothetical protein
MLENFSFFIRIEPMKANGVKNRKRLWEVVFGGIA